MGNFHDVRIGAAALSLPQNAIFTQRLLWILWPKTFPNKIECIILWSSCTYTTFLNVIRWNVIKLIRFIRFVYAMLFIIQYCFVYSKIRYTRKITIFFCRFELYLTTSLVSSAILVERKRKIFVADHTNSRNYILIRIDILKLGSDFIY